MSRPGKTGSRPLLPIEETIYRRASVNFELELFKADYYRPIVVDDDHPINKPIRPSMILTIKKQDPEGHRVMGRDYIRLDYLSDSSSDYKKKKAKIIKYVGEFY